MKTVLGLLSIFSMALYGFGQAPSCAVFNPNIPIQGFTDGSSGQHINGEHFDTGSFQNYCLYGGPPNGNPCQTTCKTVVKYTIADTGETTEEPPYIGIHWYHNIQAAWTDAVATSPYGTGGNVTCGAQFAAVVRSCVLSGCSFTVAINGSSNGLGGSLTESNTPYWSSGTHQDTNTCAGKVAPVCQAGTAPPNPGDHPPGTWVWDQAACAWFYNCIGGPDGCIVPPGYTSPYYPPYPPG